MVRVQRSYLSYSFLFLILPSVANYRERLEMSLNNYKLLNSRTTMNRGMHRQTGRRSTSYGPSDIRTLVVVKGEGKEAGRVIAAHPQGLEVTRRLLSVVPAMMSLSQRLDDRFPPVRRSLVLETGLGRLFLCGAFQGPLLAVVLAASDYPSRELSPSVRSAIGECPAVLASLAGEPPPTEDVSPCPLESLFVRDEPEGVRWN